MTKKSQGLKKRLRNADDAERAAIIAGRPYSVGFAKPPAHTQFKPGNTAGKHGRPKGSENLETIVAKVSNATVPYRDGDRQRKASMRWLIVQNIFHQALRGNFKFADLSVDLMQKHDRHGSNKPSDLSAFDERDLKAVSRAASILMPEPSTALAPQPSTGLVPAADAAELNKTNDAED